MASIDLDFVRQAIKWKNEQIKSANPRQLAQLLTDINGLLGLLEDQSEKGKKTERRNQTWLNVPMHKVTDRGFQLRP